MAFKSIKSGSTTYGKAGAPTDEIDKAVMASTCDFLEAKEVEPLCQDKLKQIEPPEEPPPPPPAEKRVIYGYFGNRGDPARIIKVKLYDPINPTDDMEKIDTWVLPPGYSDILSADKLTDDIIYFGLSDADSSGDYVLVRFDTNTDSYTFVTIDKDEHQYLNTPISLRIDRDNEFLYWHGSQIGGFPPRAGFAKINVGNNTYVHTISSGQQEPPGSIAIDYINGYCYFATAATGLQNFPNVIKVDLSDFSLDATFWINDTNMSSQDDLNNCTLTNDGATLYLTATSGNPEVVVKVDTATGSFTSTLLSYQTGDQIGHQQSIIHNNKFYAGVKDATDHATIACVDFLTFLEDNALTLTSDDDKAESFSVAVYDDVVKKSWWMDNGTTNPGNDISRLHKVDMDTFTFEGNPLRLESGDEDYHTGVLVIKKES